MRVLFVKPYLYGETIELGGGGKKEEKKKTSDPVLSALLVARRC